MVKSWRHELDQTMDIQKEMMLDLMMARWMDYNLDSMLVL